MAMSNRQRRAMFARIKAVNIDFSNIKSIQNAEKKKLSLENKGYQLKETRSLAFNKKQLIFIK